MKTWFSSATSGYFWGFCLGLVISIWGFVFLHKQWALDTCAEGASRDSLVGYVAACKALGGEPSVNIYASPPTMKCTAEKKITP